MLALSLLPKAEGAESLRSFWFRSSSGSFWGGKHPAASSTTKNLLIERRVRVAMQGFVTSGGCADWLAGTNGVDTRLTELPVFF